MAECRYCPAHIVWAITDHGKRMPIDAIDVSALGEAEPRYTPTVYGDGNVEMTGREVTHRDGKKYPEVRVVAPPRAGLHKSHFATCTGYSQKPRRKRRA